MKNLNFIEYLDNLSLLEECSLFNSIVILTIILITFNILAVFFGNEIIKYFDLENKLPSLTKFFKLRTLYQKYYLLWNIFLIYVVSIIGLGINLLVLI